VPLVKYDKGIRKGKWALPGGFVGKNEDIDDAAYRILSELTGIQQVYLEQLKAFGHPDRFPKRRVITIAYYALARKDVNIVFKGAELADAQWCRVKDVPELIFDHNDILDFAKDMLKWKVQKMPIGINLLAPTFTLLELQQLYETILETRLDKPNFRRKIMKMGVLIDTTEKQQDVSHRAARLFRFDEEKYNALQKTGFVLEV